MSQPATAAASWDPPPPAVSPEGLSGLVILIPAWQPGPALPRLVASLHGTGLRRILIVDDGSGAPFAHVFQAAAQAGAEILHHPANRGKGRALKTGFDHLLAHAQAIEGLVTADADGQHTPADILRVAQALAETVAAGLPRTVLGARAFSGDVPFRSRLGNSLTRRLFMSITGEPLQDTQTGLRGLPAALLPELLTIPGERYEYEMAVLAHLCHTGRRPLELPIQTVYLDGNVGSHFRPLRDTLQVGRALLRRRSRST